MVNLDIGDLMDLCEVDMEISKFEGITDKFHDDGIVCEYNNVIPLGSTCVDRLGETIIDPFVVSASPRGEYIDSMGWLWLSKGNLLYRLNLAQLKAGKPVDYQLFNIGAVFNEIKFAESSIRESDVSPILFITNLEKLFYWRTGDVVTQLNTNTQISLPTFGLPQDTPNGAESVSPNITISNIGWYDNKLFLVDVKNNKLHLTRTDPFWYKRGAGNRWSNNTSTAADLLWTNWYASTATADKLQDACAYNGLMYLFNEYSIEAWAQTGIESSPLQIVPNATLYVGGKKTKVVNNIMYMIAKNQIGQQFAAMIDTSGDFSKISNTEVEKRFDNQLNHIAYLSIRQSTFIMYYKSEAFLSSDREAYVYSVDTGYWWKWDNIAQSSEYAIHSIDYDIALTNKCNIVKFDANTRTYSDNTPMTRFVRDFFMQFNSRKIFRNVEFIMDTGRFKSLNETDMEIRNNLYLKISSNRGVGWGPTTFRRLAKLGENSKVMIFRNCGSGNSFLMEFGTGANTGFQLYKIILDLQ